jgi:imidazolonepropionase-like amidohydrolase
MIRIPFLNSQMLVFILLSLGFSTVQAQDDPTRITYVHCGGLIQVEEGVYDTAKTIIIHDDRISQIADGYLQVPDSVMAIDLRGSTVMPGLFDLHVHIEKEYSKDYYLERFTLNPADRAYRSVKYAKRTLEAGFTTVRDLGGTGVNISLRDAINEGAVTGPRIFTAGRSIATTGGHADPTNGFKEELMGDPGPLLGVVNGPLECRKAVRQRYKNGANVIKITATGGVLSVAADGLNPQFTEEELEAIVSTANDYGLLTAAHAHGDEGMQRAIRAGIHTIEHGTFMSDSTIQLMKDMGTYYVPTLTAGQAVAEYAEIPGYYPEVVIPKARSVGPQIQSTFERAHAAGVKIAFGTDAGVFPHGQNAREFALMVQAGMSPIETIQSATTIAARLLGVDTDLGSLSPGKVADIIAVPGNPLQDIHLMENVTFVMQDGEVVFSASEEE